MERAGAKETPADAERRGLGTPATRAATIEKLVNGGFAERIKGKLVPTDTGASLVTVLPDALRSPLLTAEWESRLKQIERGELDAETFLADIEHMVSGLVADYTPVAEASVLFPTGRTVVGKCPRCGGVVSEAKNGYFCESLDCKFGLWRDNKFLAAKRISLTRPSPLSCWIKAALTSTRSTPSAWTSIIPATSYSMTTANTPGIF